ncbi:anaphase-promoting complex subunit Hcn1 [Physocladia obscura]|uniref:Anaphase-promoting complex subunit Hcn1 n=1 Tax=Physocladia obscura TaxID=109957 RepID=A0AAD5SRF3_9FUNG|nr:anaphase-promoting complex subunit Hcn1 [Physocladia obscura]
MDEAIANTPDAKKIIENFAKDRDDWWKRQQYITELDKFGGEFSQNIARKDIKKLAIFETALDSFIDCLAMKMSSQVFKAGEFIVNTNEPSDAIYFVLAGVVEVVGADGVSVHAELTSGGFFGEVGVLLDINRTASIRAKSDMAYVFKLSKSHLNEVVSSFPSMKEFLKNAADERYTLVKKREETQHSENINGSEEKPIEQFDMEIAGQSLSKHTSQKHEMFSNGPDSGNSK